MQQEAIYEQGNMDMPCPLVPLFLIMKDTFQHKKKVRSKHAMDKQTMNEHPLKILNLLRIYQVNLETN